MCEFCDGEFTLADLGVQATQFNPQATQPEQTAHELQDWERDGAVAMDGTGSTDLVGYTCDNCQATLITGRNTGATICPYCNHTITMTSQFVGDFAPKGVVPFKFTKEQAMERFRSFLKKPFANQTVINSIEKIQGVYVPFWVYSGTVDGTIVLGAGSCVRSWSSNDKNYEEWTTAVAGRQFSAAYKNVPADASKRIDNDAMDSIEPFDLSEMQPFHPAYLSGFLAERWDETAEENFSRIEIRTYNSSQTAASKDLQSQYDKVFVLDRDLKVNNVQTDYVLLPAWLFYCEVNGKKHLYAMNGQTGKFIGNNPLDRNKMLIGNIVAGIVGILLGCLYTWLKLN